jgi:hypothetical protein
MNRLARHVWLFLLASLGCSPPPLLPTVPATGQLLYEGKPLEDAWVVFLDPLRDGKGAIAITDAEGKFTLQTHYAGNTFVTGAIPSDYLVLVGKSRPIDPWAIPNDRRPTAAEIKKARELKDGDPEALAEFMRQFRSLRHLEPASNTLIPWKYALPEESGLTASVEKGEENHFVFSIE